MIARLGLFLSRTIGRCMPDPLILALGLTIVTALLALIFGYIDLDRGEAGLQLIEDWWNSGIWVFLKFSMQMALVLVTGYALAASKPIRGLIDGIASIPHSTTSGAMVIAFKPSATSSMLRISLGVQIGSGPQPQIGVVVRSTVACACSWGVCLPVCVCACVCLCVCGRAVAWVARQPAGVCCAAWPCAPVCAACGAACVECECVQRSGGLGVVSRRVRHACVDGERGG